MRKRSSRLCAAGLRPNGAVWHIAYSELRKNLGSILDTVVQDREPVVITRGRGKPAAVLMSLEEFTSWEETVHLLRSSTNAARLMEATKALDSDAGKAGFRLSP